MAKTAIVIGAGFAGLSAATSLAAKGWQVTILEKHSQTGGRARVLEKEGFRFDMGPSWYWMPDVFETYFGWFGKKVSQYYQLVRLDPSYRVFFEDDKQIDIPAQYDSFRQLCERIEPGSSPKLDEFIRQAAYKYKVGMTEFVYKPSLSWWEFADLRLLVELFRMDLFQSMASHVRKFFKDEHLIRIMEFPVLFLGGTARSIPALYSLMNYADIQLGTWYPMGGMYRIVEAMTALAQEKGVQIRLNSPVVTLEIHQSKIAAVITDKEQFSADVVINSGDYHHCETALLPAAFRSYSESYWNSRIMAPSCLLYYLGINKRLKNLLHHNLFFDEDFNLHASEIYHTPCWPQRPLFYASVPSITDPSVAPPGCENVFLLIPVAAGLPDSPQIREKYYHIVMERLERRTGETIRPHVIVKETFAYRDFVSEYHSFKGNAYGLANTLFQTAIFKPALRSKKVRNLFHTGQLTVPGPGVPPSLISGQVVARLIEEVMH
ncbi:MAG: phytoene desaturase family protein [Cytophagales bacterium]|nr:phytoene desaturase family protein [Bernardetiaceae bacterium]MDW8210907.1 phytoene desaturase family protein [Cytophagales bacterium]